VGHHLHRSHLLLLAVLATLVACQAPATLSSTATPPQLSSDLAKYEPPDGLAYFGFTFKLWDLSPPKANAVWGDTRPFAERIRDSIQVELAGKAPTILKVQNEWQSRNGAVQPFSTALADINKVHAAAGPTVVPMVEWQAEISGYPPGGYRGVTTRDIVSGVFDGYITQYARDVKKYGKPLFVRLICGEFNGSWWQCCSPKANPKLTTTDFVSAWRRVVDIFRQEGVTNVAWIWTPVAFPPPPADWGQDPNWQAYYPGDDYVDWVGGDMNDWGLPHWLDPLYQFGIDHGKPFFLAEFAIRHQGTTLTHAQQVQWLEAMFDYIESHPQIKAISYFNYKNNPDNTLGTVAHVYLYDGQVNYVPNVNDHDQRLIAGGEDMRTLFARRIANPRYISTLVVGP
jgi:hypothetical protein